MLIQLAGNQKPNTQDFTNLLSQIKLNLDAIKRLHTKAKGAFVHHHKEYATRLLQLFAEKIYQAVQETSCQLGSHNDCNTDKEEWGMVEKHEHQD